MSARYALGDLSGAKSAIARLFAIDPNSYHGHLAEGNIKRALNDRFGALAAFLRAAAIMPKAVQPLIEIAVEKERSATLTPRMQR